MKYNIGDKVIVRTHSRTDQSPNWFVKNQICGCLDDSCFAYKGNGLDSEVETIIVGASSSEYDYNYIVIAPDDFDGHRYNDSSCTKYSIAEKHNSFRLKGINERAILRIVKSEPAKLDGCFCADCNKYCHMSVPNLTFQGKEIMVCFSCRNTNSWKWKV